ncbi:hypothetical protein AAG906_014299 [Vitis piasezkii]
MREVVERKTVKVLIERKTFLITLEGVQGGEWCSMTEISRGSVFTLSFEKEAVGWLVECLTKALALKSHMGFNKKFRGKCRAHLLEVGFNNHGRFIRISEFATNRRPFVLIIPEGDKGRGWESIKKALDTMLVVPYPNRDRENWAEVGRLVARRLGKNGVVTIVPFSAGKGVFFVETTKEAIFLHDLRELRVGERNIIQLRSPEEDSGAMGVSMLEVTDGDWVFTIVVVVVGDEERRRGSGKGRRGSAADQAEGRYRVGEDNRPRKEGERGKGYQLQSQSRLKSTDGMDGIGEAGDWAGEDDADVGCRAQDSSSAIKREISSGLLEVHRAKKVMYGSRKLWSTFFPPSSEHRQGIRSSSEPISRGKSKVDSEEDPKTDDLGAEAQANRGLNASPLFSPCSPRLRKKKLGERDPSPRKEADLNSFSSNEDMEGSLGRVGSDSRGSAAMVKPSSPETRDKGPSLMGNCASRFAEILEVIQPACPYLMSESVNSLSANLSSHCKESSKATVHLGGIAGSPSGEFQIEGLSPRKMAKVREVLKTLDIKDFGWSFRHCWAGFSALVCGGDFNVIRRSSRKLGGSRLTPSMKDFDDFISDCELIDLPLRSASFTWSNMQENPVCKRLDRFLYSNEWEQTFPQSIQGVLPRWTSDHWPIVLETNPLESPFTEEEIFKAIFQMDRDKAPGPDGFTIAVFQDCWEVIKEDLVKVFAEFHRSGIINQSTNASFIVLLPKKSMSRRISDFRPISLITSLYKIIAKVLAGRLRGMKGFGLRWRKWMRGCLSSVSFAVLVNGNAKGWVKASRGLRQGDPLSPFLFTIVADVLSRMLLKAEERNVLEGFRVGRNRTRVSHLQFADDTIFFSSSREEDMMNLKSILLVFGHISGLKVNLDKSNIYGINLEQNHLSRLAEMLDCKASGWPILYLGLPLGGNPKASGFWDPVIERISRRLDGWQKAYLSFGGRITLIQSCLTHMPCYFLSLFKIPPLWRKIERMQRDFYGRG